MLSFGEAEIYKNLLIVLVYLRIHDLWQWGQYVIFMQSIVPTYSRNLWYQYIFKHGRDEKNLGFGLRRLGLGADDYLLFYKMGLMPTLYIVWKDSMSTFIHLANIYWVYAWC